MKEIERSVSILQKEQQQHRSETTTTQALIKTNNQESLGNSNTSVVPKFTMPRDIFASSNTPLEPTTLNTIDLPSSIQADQGITYKPTLVQMVGLSKDLKNITKEEGDAPDINLQSTNHFEVEEIFSVDHLEERRNNCQQRITNLSTLLESHRNGMDAKDYNLCKSHIQKLQESKLMTGQAINDEYLIKFDKALLNAEETIQSKIKIIIETAQTYISERLVGNASDIFFTYRTKVEGRGEIIERRFSSEDTKIKIKNLCCITNFFRQYPYSCVIEAAEKTYFCTELNADQFNLLKQKLIQYITTPNSGTKIELCDAMYNFGSLGQELLDLLKNFEQQKEHNIAQYGIKFYKNLKKSPKNSAAYNEIKAIISDKIKLPNIPEDQTVSILNFLNRLQYLVFQDNNRCHIEMRALYQVRNLHPNIKEFNIGLAHISLKEPACCASCCREIYALERTNDIKINFPAAAIENWPTDKNNWQPSKNITESANFEVIRRYASRTISSNNYQVRESSPERLKDYFA
jgi:hypothetical protein